ncbi:PREDICTED: uncharacterized protein LOC108548429 [Eufriesea mexicana]|uniref:uncharacterized protein LOC108548429 n=1 Tax=Eufriesea mexicana TaxID=516756 RepID=UPI00083C14C5|nr:PREDICTED: uncharacterized protein LOC108548429 [Eufriesea mexicana]
MKCFVAIVLLALCAVALAAEKPLEPEKLEPQQQPNVEGVDGPRDKRTPVLAYTAPLAYTSYISPYTYAASYGLPYAYSASYYRSYPYYYNTYY